MRFSGEHGNNRPSTRRRRIVRLKKVIGWTGRTFRAWRPEVLGLWRIGYVNHDELNTGKLEDILSVFFVLVTLPGEVRNRCG